MMNMNKTIDNIEALSYDLATDIMTEKDIWTRIDSIPCSNRDLIKVIDWFLTNLSRQHMVPGADYAKLSGIGHWIRQHDYMTLPQRRYSLLCMATYWAELDLFLLSK
jgi:hypothetical protein